MKHKYEAQTKSSKLKLCPAFIVAAVREILTLHNLLHNVIGVNAGVVHTAGLPLHVDLLPSVVGPDIQQQGDSTPAPVKYRQIKALLHVVIYHIEAEVW